MDIGNYVRNIASLKGFAFVSTSRLERSSVALMKVW